MKIKDMKPGVRYRVLSDGEPFAKGDIVGLSESYGAWAWLRAEEAKWFTKGEWKQMHNEIEIDADYYRREIAQLVAGIEDCQKIIDKHKSILEGAEQ